MFAAMGVNMETAYFFKQVPLCAALTCFFSTQQPFDWSCIVQWT